MAEALKGIYNRRHPGEWVVLALSEAKNGKGYISPYIIPRILRAYFRRNGKLLKFLVQSANWTAEKYFTGAIEIEIDGADGDAIENIARYMSRAAISVDKVEFNPEDNTLTVYERKDRPSICPLTWTLKQVQGKLLKPE